MSLITDRRANLDLFSHEDGFHFDHEGRDYVLPSLEKVHAFFQKQPFDTVKLCQDDKKQRLHYIEDDVRIFDSKMALRETLTEESGGAWVEEKEGKKRYFVDDSRWFQTSFKQVSKEEYLQKLQSPSTIQKVLGIGLSILALLPGALEINERPLFKASEVGIGLLALHEKSSLLGTLGFFLLPSSAQAQAVGAEFQVNNYTDDHQDFPSVAGLVGGEFVVAWASLNQDGDQYGIYGQRFSSDARAIGSEFQVHTVTASVQRSPSVAALVDVGFIVTWEGFNDNYDIFGQRYDAKGARAGSEFIINNVTISVQDEPSIAPLTDGGFVTVWTSVGQDGALDGIFAQRYDSISIPRGPEFQINNYTTHNQDRPDVAPLKDGGFVVIWQSFGQDGDFNGIFGQRFNINGSTVGSEFQANTYVSDNQLSPNTASLTDGGFVITWGSDGQDGENWGVYAQRYDSAGNTVGSEFQVNTYTTLSQNAPSVAGLNDGGFVITWQSENQDGDSLGIYAQRYDLNSTTSGSEFLVNTFTTGAQGSPKVASLADGGFIVVWESFSQDGNRNGIFGKRYGRNGMEIFPPTLAPITSTFSSNSRSSDGSSIFSASPLGASAPFSESISIKRSETNSKQATLSQKEPSASLSSSKPPPNDIFSTGTVPDALAPSLTRMQTTLQLNPTSSPSGFFIPSIVDLVYEEPYSIVVNDQVIGTFTFSGGSGNLQRGVQNTLTIEIDPDKLPENGEKLILFVLPDYEDWDIVLSGISTDCRKAIEEIEENDHGEYEYTLYIEDGTCSVSSSLVLPSAIYVITN